MKDKFMGKIRHILRRVSNEKKRKNRTEYIIFNSGKCVACWKCIEECKKNVFGKINILIHKHIVIRNEEECTGCGRCVKVCRTNALIYSGK